MEPNINIPDRVIRLIVQNVPKLNMGDLQVPPVLNVQTNSYEASQEGSSCDQL